MLHEEDPRDKLLNDLGDLSGFTLLHNQVLVAVYQRPEKTKSGLILASQTRGEDQFQGKSHLVVKKGPKAFVSTDEWQFPPVEVGQWVVIRPSDGWSVGVQGARGLVLCRNIVDTSVKWLIPSPDLIW